jgi:hypothetical protein
VASSGKTPQSSQGLAAEAQRAPFLDPLGAELLVEAERRVVPVQRHPFEARAVALDGDRGQPPQHGGADAQPPPARADVDVLQPEPGTRLEGGEGGEEDGIARRLAVGLDEQGLAGLAVEERALEQLGAAVDLVGQLLVLGQLQDQLEEERRVAAGRLANQDVNVVGRGRFLAVRAE